MVTGVKADCKPSGRKLKDGMRAPTAQNNDDLYGLHALGLKG